MSSPMLRMLLPLTLLAATGIPADPACASTSNGTGTCGRAEVRDIAKNTKVIAAPASRIEPRTQMEAL